MTVDLTRCCVMTSAHLAAVVDIESVAYELPWTRNNFIDSLAAGHFAEVLLAQSGEVIGYHVAMCGVGETHLLNVTVAPAFQRQGHGRALLDRVCDWSAACHASLLWLEVRQSNVRARSMYQRYGFSTVGVRRRYYPKPDGQREDAMVMNLRVPVALATEQQHELG